MAAWQVYQQIAIDLDVPPETMHLVNVLADGGYLTENQPPYLNYDLPDFGTQVTWLEKHPTQGIAYCKERYGKDAAVAATIHAVGTEVAPRTDGDLAVGFAILGNYLDDFLQDISRHDIATEVEKVRSYFDANTIELKRIEDAHSDDENPYEYCDYCGDELDTTFSYRCGTCGTRFPGWAALVFAEGEEQSNSKWREQLDVTVLSQNIEKRFLVLRSKTSLPGWIEEGGQIGQIIDGSLQDMGRVVNVDNRDIQVDYWGGVASSLEAGVDEDTIVGHLDLEAVRHAPLYPFRYYQAYTALQNADVQAPAVERWLEDAIDVAVETVPDGLGDTFVAVDLSGSMDMALSRNSTLRLKEIGALFGAILAEQGAEVGGFGDDFLPVSMHVDTPVLQRQDVVLAIDEDVGNSTNGWKALEYLRGRGEPVERIVVFTDMQIWDSTPFMARDNQTVKAAFDAYQNEVSTDTSLYLVDLASYGDLVTPEGYENVYNVSGWSENVLSFIEHAENPKQVIDEVDAFEPA
jgi:hypothetical protein